MTIAVDPGAMDPGDVPSRSVHCVGQRGRRSRPPTARPGHRGGHVDRRRCRARRSHRGACRASRTGTHLRDHCGAATGCRAVGAGAPEPLGRTRDRRGQHRRRRRVGCHSGHRHLVDLRARGQRGATVRRHRVRAARCGRCGHRTRRTAGRLARCSTGSVARARSAGGRAHAFRRWCRAAPTCTATTTPPRQRTPTATANGTAVVATAPPWPPPTTRRTPTTPPPSTTRPPPTTTPHPRHGDGDDDVVSRTGRVHGTPPRRSTCRASTA